MSLHKVEQIIIKIFCVIYGGGVIAHLSPFLFPLAQSLTETLLYSSNALVFYFALKSSSSHISQQDSQQQTPQQQDLQQQDLQQQDLQQQDLQQASTKLFWWIVIAAVVTFFIEVAGVATGKVFGPYEYGETLQLKAWGVPFVIGLNWVILTLGGFSIVQSLLERFFSQQDSPPGSLQTRHALSLQQGFKKTIKNIVIPLLTAIIVVVFDWIMEPIAIWLDYWHWYDAPIPLKNYFAWFIIAFIASFVLQQLRLKIRSKLLVAYFVIQLIFFVLLRIFGEIVLST